MQTPNQQALERARSQARNMAQYIDHTLLKAEATPSEIETACQEAITYQFASVCVNSSYIEKVSGLLKSSPTKPIAVVGFPLGACATEVKVQETKYCVAHGAQEIDMVLNLGALKSGNRELVLKDIEAVVLAAHPIPVKVILETAALSPEEKIIACELAQKAKAAFVKTSTGFHPKGGATIEDVALLRKLVGPDMGVKASGGIRTTDDALQMIRAGATRIGASSSVAIVSGLETSSKDYDKSY